MHEHPCSTGIYGQGCEVHLKGTADPNVANVDGQRALQTYKQPSVPRRRPTYCMSSEHFIHIDIGRRNATGHLHVYGRVSGSGEIQWAIAQES